MDLDKVPGYLASKITFHLMCRQAVTGFPFDVEKAKEVLAAIGKEMKEIEWEVEPQLPPRPLKKSEQNEFTFPKKPFKADGTLSSHGQKFLEKHGLVLIGVDHVEWSGRLEKIVGGKLLPVEVPMQLSEESTPLKNWFLSLGWVPKIWNYKKDERGKNVRDEKGNLIRTSPKIHEKGEVCPNLFEVAGDFGPMIKKIATYFSLKHRYSTVNSWMNHPRIQVDGCLPSGSSGITNTHRQKHTVVCNVPKAEEGVLYGKEMRSLFTPFEGHVQVGFDAKALENRIEAHYCYDIPGGKEYAEEILNGDPHTKNAFIFFPDKIRELGLSLETASDDPRFKKFRSRAKNGKYCLNYGGQAAKLASTLGHPEWMGKELYEAFWEQNVTLNKFKKKLEMYWETVGRKKWIVGLDGRFIPSRSKHSLVNLQFQSGGAIVMDYAFLFIDKWLGGLKKDSSGRPGYLFKDEWVYRMTYQHDEGQFSSPMSVADDLGELCVRAIESSGKYLKTRVPMEGEYIIGTNWSECH